MRRAGTRVPEELKRLFDIAGGKDTGVSDMHGIVQLKRDQRRIFHHEHGTPRSGLTLPYQPNAAKLSADVE